MIELKASPDKTGWYVITRVTASEEYFIGPYETKLEAVEVLKERINGLRSMDFYYKVARYFVSITLDTKAGTWTPKTEDYEN
jgi:hypothetical protein